MNREYSDRFSQGNTGNGADSFGEGVSISDSSGGHSEGALLVPQMLPGVELPKGGGALRSIDESFRVNPVNGANTSQIRLPVTPTRIGFSPALALSYNSGGGQGAFGLGWNVTTQAIIRSTTRKLPEYENDDAFSLGGEELVPELIQSGGHWQRRERETADHVVRYFRPRTEGSWQRIEQWQDKVSGLLHWRTISASNVISVFGPAPESRLADPANPARVFQWMLSHTYDDRGNLVVYRYKHEDFLGMPDTLWERNRGAENCTNIYLKRVFYGNQTPFRTGDLLPDDNDFLFENVFDFGEHEIDQPAPDEVHFWPVRDDPFSTYRAGFEIRTYRLCRRVLLFHRFNELPVNPCLVSATELTYHTFPGREQNDNDIPGMSFLKSVTQRGYLFDEAAGAYKSKTLPTVSYFYQSHNWNTDIQTANDSDNLPQGVMPPLYRWVDLFGEGLAGVLSEQGGRWLYKRSEGNGKFSPVVTLPEKPSLTGLNTGALHLQPLTASGRPHLVSHAPDFPGYFRLEENNQWSSFTPFESFPGALGEPDPDSRYIDLTGDGKPDLVMSGDTFFQWHPSEGEQGFGERRLITHALDEQEGPRCVFSDREQVIFLADMSGDGLTDIVRIRNRNVCYWANLGYGRFSRMVTLANAPEFAPDDVFEPDRIRISDVDGTGPADLLYVDNGEVRCWFNLSGNRFSDVRTVSIPAFNNECHLEVADFLGNGTACLVWSSALEAEKGSPLRYVDLMAGKKPHLMIAMENGSGRTVSWQYGTSTRFYLEDKTAGKPWATKVPFPVHVVTDTEVVDEIRNTRFVSSYRYHHGYFDARDREFRGFGKVEQIDTENYTSFSREPAGNVLEEAHHQPPVRTVSWFHSGAPPSLVDLQSRYRDEYFENTAVPEYHPETASLPGELSSNEWLDAWRAMRGALLRQEIYADDGTELAGNPYRVNESCFQLKRIQPEQIGVDKNRGDDIKHPAVFQRLSRESIGWHYDRNPDDPRISHAITLKSDERGFPLLGATVAYPRVQRPDGIPDPLWQRQNRTHISLSQALYTADIDTDDAFRLREPFEQKSFQLNGLLPESSFFTLGEIEQAFLAAPELAFEMESDGSLSKRLLSHSRVYFRSDNLAAQLPLGQRESLGLVFRGMQLAMTPGLVALRYGSKVSTQMLEQAGYIHSEGDANWWIPSGTSRFGVGAANRFYLPDGAVDALGVVSLVRYDPYLLRVIENENALGMVVTAELDYRTLTPWQITDANMNRTAVETDELGLVVKMAVMGKASENEGDTLESPTQRIEYDLLRWQATGEPNFTHVFNRETHEADLADGEERRWQEQYVYFDGSGEPVMVKSQAGPGDALRWNEAENRLESVHTDTRWVGNGRVVVNNKGWPVKSFEPYFSLSPDYETEAALVEIGTPAVRHYDPVGRSIRTDFPDGTFSRTEHGSWQSAGWDQNDTVLESDWYQGLGSPVPDAPIPADADKRVAWLTAQHANTPAVTHSDVLGRPALSVADLGNGNTTSIRSEADDAGRHIRLFDQLGREVSFGASNFVGGVMYANTAEKGERWILPDIGGRMFRIWDSQGRIYSMTHDGLHRPVSSVMTEGGQSRVISHTVYGDSLPDAVARNLVGVVHQIYDQAGVTKVMRAGFSGQALEAQRRLTRSYQGIIDWSVLTPHSLVANIEAAAEPLLEAETFTTRGEYDAIGRVTSSTLSDGTIVTTGFDEGGLIQHLDAQVRGAGAVKRYLNGQSYNARGEREFVRYGNGLFCEFGYDPLTHRLVSQTARKSDTDPLSASVQRLVYRYDPVGNLMESRDLAQQTHYFDNAVVEPLSRYRYDALYQLVEATGREHAGAGWDSQPDSGGRGFSPLPHTNDSQAVRNFTESYQYDVVGNIQQISHHTATPQGRWTRRYRYEYELDIANRTNRLHSTSLSGDADGGPYSAVYAHDSVGNITAMPGLSQLDWNFADQLTSADLGGGGLAFFVYGISGRRRRKVVERPGGSRTERIYLGANEIYRERNANGDITLERWTLHISDGTGRIVQIDTKTIDTANSDPVNPLNENLERYSLGNLTGSATVELDKNGEVISYEEYHPFGTSAYRSSKPGTDLSLKRYRFCGKERDAETGLYYSGARYLIGWLGRWLSSDPAGLVDGLNTFAYSRNNPVGRTDPSGTQSQRVVVEMEVTGEESFQDLKNVAIPEGWQWNPDITAQNYRQYWDGQYWNVWVPVTESPPEPEPPPPDPPDEPVEDDPSPVTTTNAARTTQAVIRTRQPTLSNGQPAPGNLHLYSGQTGNNQAMAAAATGENYYLRDTPHYQNALNDVADIEARLGRPLTPSDYHLERPVWDAHSRALTQEATLAGRGVESHGLPTYQAETGRPASGTTQVMEEIPTALRYGSLNAVLGFASGGLTIYTGSQMDNPVMQGVGYVAGAGEIAGTARYVQGMYQLYTWTPGSAATMAGGAALARYSGGLGLIVMSGYTGAVHMATGEYGLLVSDAAGYVGGTAMLAGSMPVAAVAGGVAVTNVLGDYVERKVTPSHGRTAGVAAGTASGAAAGAAIGAAIGVWGFGVGAAPAAAVGAVVGGIAGFIGSFW